MRITIFLALTLSTFIFFTSCNKALAQGSDVGSSSLHPAHPLYFLKAVREGIELRFAQTPRAKLIRQLEFATRRLREVNSLISKNRGDLIEPNLERYWFHLNTVLQYRPREEWLTLLLNYTIATHLNVLEENSQKVDPDGRAKISIRTAIYRILKNSDITENPRIKGCDFLSLEATSSGLTQAESAIWQQRAISCYPI